MMPIETPLLMFAILLVFLAAGIPIAFALAFVALGSSFVLWGPKSLSLIVTSSWNAMNTDPLIAVPLFIFMAYALQKAGIVGDLYGFFYKWSGPVRGGLAIATIAAGALIGAMSGVVAAGVIGLGVISLPEMRKRFYQLRISLGCILAGGTLGQLIPPSINMVIYGVVGQVSVGGLFAGGITCGLTLAGLYVVYILVRSHLNKNLCPVLPPEERADWHEKVVSIRGVAAPGLLIVLVLGSILGGVATPTEAAAVGCFGTVAYAVGARRFGVQLLRETCTDTIKVGAMCMWIVVGAQVFSAVFAGVGGNQLVAQWLTQLPFGAWGALVFSLIIVFFLGMFIETIAIIMLAVPILAPVMVNLGFDPLWYGIVFNVVLQTAFLSPPFGIALFYLKSVAPADVPLLEIYKASVPFLCLQWLCVALFLAFPQLVVWLPHKLFP